jgi:D-glycero-D-manno-heptose 1,7-bisphosphate phosphatase
MRPQWVFLDRDGTLNEAAPPHRYIVRAEDLVLLAGAGDAVARLNHAGLWVGLVTNQRGVALGELSLEELDRVHDRLRELLAEHGAHLDGVWSCPHHEGACDCRKPAPGLLLRAQREVPEIDLTRAVMIGDSDTDIAAGRSVGATTIRLGGDCPAATRSAPDLAAAVDLVLSATPGAQATAGEGLPPATRTAMSSSEPTNAARLK